MSNRPSDALLAIPNMLRDWMTAEQGCHDGIGHVDAFRAFDRAASDEHVDFIDFVRIPPKSSIGRHFHGDNTEWYVITSGTGDMYFKGETMVVKPWDVLINPPHHQHGLENLSDDDVTLVVFETSRRPLRDSPIVGVEARHLAHGLTEEAALAGVCFDHGSAAYVFDTEGRKYIDLGAGILTQNVGHSHPHVVAAVQTQAARLTNIHDSSTPERARLCALLAEFFPPYLSRFAFFSSGTEAIEAAVRAVHGHVGPSRPVIAALRGGFHGKTQGSRALVNWNIGGVDTSPRARQFGHACATESAEQIAREILASDDIGAFVFEPVQAAGGVIVPPRDYWGIVADACRRKGVLMVADEIVSAGGRIGTFLACDHYGIAPDLVVAAKGLSSGIPFSLLAGREDIMTAGHFASPGASSSTFGGNPLSCAAVIATLEVLRDEKVIEGVASRARHLMDGLSALRAAFPDAIADVRGIGLLTAIEFGAPGETRAECEARARRFYSACLQRGVRVGLGGAIARIGPPLTITHDDISVALRGMHDALAVG